jgi:alcohol dehydrogenase class IV
MGAAWSFATAGEMIFGRGSLARLAPLVAARQWNRALLISDQNLVAAGAADKVTKELDAAKIAHAIFPDTEPEPSLETAAAAIAFGKTVKPEVVVGLGGGSNMDLAKVVAATLQHGGTASDYFGFDRVPGPTLPLVCIPTTAGTGSEVSHSAVLTDVGAEMKVSMQSPFLRPSVALIDPALAVSCPRQVTAESGIDALVHAIEAVTAIDAEKMPAGNAYSGRTPLTDALAEQAISLVGKYLVRAVEVADDLEAREGMAAAALLAGMAFSNAGVAVVHALEYPLGGALHCSHGGGNGMLLPFVMRFNLPVRRETFARIAELLGEAIADLALEDAAERAIVAVEKLRGRIGIPSSIRELGGREDQLAGFAEKAFAVKRLMQVNPRPVSLADLKSILQSAF